MAQIWEDGEERDNETPIRITFAIVIIQYNDETKTSQSRSQFDFEGVNNSVSDSLPIRHSHISIGGYRFARILNRMNTWRLDPGCWR